jgi:predicted metal-dependent hydrolase
MAENSTQSKTVHIPDIGEIKITRRRKCRRLCISVNKSKAVKVSIPYRVSFSEGEKFIFDKIDWIKKSLIKIDLAIKPNQLFDENSELRTRSRNILIRKWIKNKFALVITKTEITISYPWDVDIQLKTSQNAIKTLIVKALRFEAKEYLPERVKVLAAQNNFQYLKVKINTARTRWGSCSYKNSINLNAGLILLPDILSDYVILHELAHTVHKNHGPSFWKLLETIANAAKEKSKQLKDYKLEVYYAI